MGNKIKKKKIRWDRLGMLVLACIILLASLIWIVRVLFGQEQLPKSQTISTATSVKQYNQPQKGDDGVYRIENTIIVNKKYGLPETYNPGENTEAANQVKQMLADMQKQQLRVLSDYVGYRSFDTQKQLYEKYSEENGQEKADTFSARPGFSEHQTGLAFDIVDTSGELIQAKNDEKATQWIQNHAHEYGFIVRYMQDKESITGYIHEEWHVRYVGKELAQKMYESKLSLEEYYNIEGGGYK